MQTHTKLNEILSIIANEWTYTKTNQTAKGTVGNLVVSTSKATLILSCVSRDPSLCDSELTSLNRTAIQNLADPQTVKEFYGMRSFNSVSTGVCSYSLT